MTDKRKSVDVLQVSRFGSMAGMATVVPRLGSYEVFRVLSLLHACRVGTERDAVMTGTGEHNIVPWAGLSLNSQKGLLLVDFFKSQWDSWTRLADMV